MATILSRGRWVNSTPDRWKDIRSRDSRLIMRKAGSWTITSDSESKNGVLEAGGLISEPGLLMSELYAANYKAKLNTWGRTKWPVFCIRLLQVYFLVWKLLYIGSNITKTWSQLSIQQYMNIGSDNGLAPIRRQAIIWTNDDSLLWWYIVLHCAIRGQTNPLDINSNLK